MNFEFSPASSGRDVQVCSEDGSSVNQDLRGVHEREDLHGDPHHQRVQEYAQVQRSGNHKLLP